MPPPPRHNWTASAILSSTANGKHPEAAKDAAALAEWNSKKWVWVPNESEGYKAGWVVKEDGDHSVIALESGEMTQPIPTLSLLRVNPPTYEKADDIADLTYLNEASVVHNLKSRYSDDSIYVRAPVSSMLDNFGPPGSRSGAQRTRPHLVSLFLVAVNPYKTLPIYTPKVIERFKNRRRDENAPHVYAVAEKAWQSMLAHREQSQSILVTGESGAGKTENTKKVIQYLAAIAADPLPSSSSFDLLASRAGVLQRQATTRQALEDGGTGKKLGQLERQILEANPILEAFGNAQTVKNNNSSRFGKFVRIFFNPIGAIAGANIDWYLLEKSRVTARSEHERAFHIFFQLLRGADPSLKERLLLSGEARDYEYLKHSRVTVEGMDDKVEFRGLLHALDTVGFSPDEQYDLFRVIAAILHLGNIDVVGTDKARLADPTQLERVCHLLGLSASELARSLTEPKVLVGGREWMTQSRTNKQVMDELGALSKSLYERNFGRMVDRINKALGRPSTKTFIGVLDIAGFEIFQTNGFEQLCINLTNEKLQQFFNYHMFVLEQEEYGREGIEWEKRNFGLELQPTIDLIESNNPMGILSCLDDACLMPQASDATFTRNLHQLAAKKPVATQFSKYAASRIEQGFTVSHYAGDVEYRTDGWLDKNRDPLSDALTSLLANSTAPYIASMFAEYADNIEEPAFDGPRKRVRKGAFGTVGQRHKEQLAFLMAQLKETQPHFVRCIVPNMSKLPGVIDTPLVLDQLRCNGVLEGIRIARLGFPNRLPFAEFRRRFEVLVPGKIPKGFIDGKEACRRILDTLELDAAMYQLGLTKIFFKAGILAELEERRDEYLSDIFTRVQAACRMFVARRQANKTLKRAAAVRIIQHNARLYGQLRAWPWWPLFQRVRPLLAAARSDSEVRRKAEELAAAKEKAEREEKERERLQAVQMELEATQARMEKSLASEQARGMEREELLLASKGREAALQEEVTFLSGELKMADTQLDRAMEANGNLKRQRDDLDLAVTNSNALVQTLQAEQQAWKAKEAEFNSQTSVKTAEWQAVLLDRDAKASAVSKLNLDIVDARRDRERLTASIADLERRLAVTARESAEARKKILLVESDARSVKEEAAKLDKEKREALSTITTLRNDLSIMQNNLALVSAERDASTTRNRDLEIKVSSSAAQVTALLRQLDDHRLAAEKAAADLVSLTRLLDVKSSDHERQSQLNKLKETEIQTLKLQVSKITSELASVQRTAADESARLRQDLDRARSESSDVTAKNVDLSRRVATGLARITELEAVQEQLQQLQHQHDLQIELVRTEAAEDTLREREKWDKEKTDLAVQFQRFEDATLAAERASDGLRHDRDALGVLLQAEQATVQLRDAKIQSLNETIEKQYHVLADHDQINSDLRAEMRQLESRLRLAEDRGGKFVVEHIRVLEEAQRFQNAEMEKMRADRSARDAYVRTLESARVALTQQVEDFQHQRDAERRQQLMSRPPADNKASKLAAELEAERRLRQETDVNLGRLRSEIQHQQLQLEASAREMAELKKLNTRFERELNTLAASDYTESLTYPRPSDRRMQESRAANVPSPTRNTFVPAKPTPPPASPSPSSSAPRSTSSASGRWRGYE